MIDYVGQILVCRIIVELSVLLAATPDICALPSNAALRSLVLALSLYLIRNIQIPYQFTPLRDVI